MKRLKKSLILSTLLFSNMAYSGGISDFVGGLVNRNQDAPIYGEAQRFYDLEQGTTRQSNRLTDFVKELHSEYNLFIAEYTRPKETYINDHNKDKLKSGAKITAYSSLKFSKRGEGYRLYYSPYKSNGDIIIKLGTKYNKQIDGIYDDIQREASFVKIKGTSSYARGGSHLMARNLPKLKTLTLICKKTIYSDKSGGNSCKTVVEKVNFNNSDTTVLVDGANGKSIVPVERLKTWKKDFWNGDI